MNKELQYQMKYQSSNYSDYIREKIELRSEIHAEFRERD